MGKFIVFEGLDGCGKTSQIDILARRLKEKGEKVYVTAEPTNYETGLYLDDGYTVICDRYYYSSLAYQGKNPNCNFEWILNLNLNCERLLTPDICLFLDVNPSTCKDRIDVSRDNIELYEKSVEEMSNIRRGFLDVFSTLKKDYSQNIMIIDANGSIDDVAKEILKYV